MKNKLISLKFVLWIVAVLFTSCLNHNRDVREQWQEFNVLDADQQTLLWEEDLRFFSEKLQRKHYQLSLSISPDLFESLVDALISESADLDSRQIFGDLQKLAAMVGDGNTQVVSSFPVYQFPIRMQAFSEGVFVVDATEEYSYLLGRQLLYIGSLRPAEVYHLIDPYLSASTETEKALRRVEALNQATLLSISGVLSQETQGVFTFLDEENQKETLLIPAEEDSAIHFHKEAPQAYSFQTFQEGQILLFRYNRSEEMEDFPMEAAVEELRIIEENNAPEFFIIDFRENRGGDKKVLKPMIDFLLEESSLNRRGRLFAAIGRASKGSAMDNIVELRDSSEVILIGENTSGKPNHLGQVKSFLLPNTGIEVLYSSQFIQLEDRISETLEPQIPIYYSIEDYRRGVDPLIDLFRQQLEKQED